MRIVIIPNSLYNSGFRLLVPKILKIGPGIVSNKIVAIKPKIIFKPIIIKNNFFTRLFFPAP